MNSESVGTAAGSADALEDTSIGSDSGSALAQPSVAGSAEPEFGSAAAAAGSHSSANLSPQ